MLEVILYKPRATSSIPSRLCRRISEPGSEISVSLWFIPSIVYSSSHLSYCVNHASCGVDDPLDLVQNGAQTLQDSLVFSNQ